MRYLGVDLAWSDSTRVRETGVAAPESDGRVGWAYDDGLSDRFPESARRVSECYPYTTLVGTHELAYDPNGPCTSASRDGYLQPSGAR